MFGAIFMVYGYNDANLKRQMWQEILEVRNGVNVLILVIGDFNEVRSPVERKGCSTMTFGMKDFDDWINCLGVIELPLIEPVWMQKIKSMQLQDIPCSLSDHIPLVLGLKEINWGPKPFRTLDA